MKENFPIDFVVTWVDGSDPKWIEKKNRYSKEAGSTKKSMNSAKAYREWGTFKYWFRGVEKFAPWVNKVYLVTDGQIPDFLDLECSKVKLITHDQIIKKEYLPTFNANTLEMNLKNIPNLSEHFVYFNDDMYITSPVEPSDFFSKDGMPIYNTSLSPIVPQRYGTAHFQVNDMEIVTSHFTRDEILNNGDFFNPKQGLKNWIKTLLYRNSKFICGFFEDHMPYPLLKSTMELLWDEETEVLEKTSCTRFRMTSDTNIWLFKYWQIASGDYEVGKKMGKLFSLDDAGPTLWRLINSHKYKVMCLNDGFEVQNEKAVENGFIGAMDKLFPKKSNFEK